MNFKFSTSLCSFPERFEVLFAFPKVFDILGELSNFTAILDVPSCLLFCLSCPNDVYNSGDIYNLMHFSFENNLLFFQIYTNFIKILEFFHEISLLNTILFDLVTALGFTLSFTQYFVSHTLQTQTAQNLLTVSLLHSKLFHVIDKDTVLLSKDFQYLLNFM